jgi:hypothetical protein
VAKKVRRIKKEQTHSEINRKQRIKNHPASTTKVLKVDKF